MSMQADSVFSGISTFGRLPYQPCLQNPDAIYDIAFIGEYFSRGTTNCTPLIVLIKARRSILERRTARALGSARPASVKALAD